MYSHFDREKLIWEAKLPTIEKFVLLALNSFVDAEGECFPGQERLAEMIGCNKRTIVSAIASLVSKEIIEKSIRLSKAGRTSNRYRVQFDILKSQSANIALTQSANIALTQSANIALTQSANIALTQSANIARIADGVKDRAKSSQSAKFAQDLSSINNYPDHSNYPEREPKSEPGTSARSQKFEPEPELKPEPKYPTSIQNFESSYQAIAPWKASRRRCDYNPAFIQHILGYLKKLPSAEKRTPDLTDAKGWIVRRESTEQGLGEIQIQWDAFIESGAEKKVEATTTDFSTWKVTDPRHRDLFHWFRTEGLRMDDRGDLAARYRQWILRNELIEDQLLALYPEVAA
jgi:hypothetical protein